MDDVTPDEAGRSLIEPGKGESVMTIARCSAALLFIASSAAVVVPAQSQSGQPAYVGRWSYDPAHCKNKPGSDEAPLVMTRKGIEGACTFQRITGGNGFWRAQIACTDKGGMGKNRNLEIRVQGKTLTLTYRDGLRGVDEFKRC